MRVAVEAGAKSPTLAGIPRPSGPKPTFQGLPLAPRRPQPPSRTHRPKVCRPRRLPASGRKILGGRAGRRPSGALTLSLPRTATVDASQPGSCSRTHHGNRHTALGCRDWTPTHLQGLAALAALLPPPVPAAPATLPPPPVPAAPLILGVLGGQTDPQAPGGRSAPVIPASPVRLPVLPNMTTPTGHPQPPGWLRLGSSCCLTELLLALVPWSPQNAVFSRRMSPLHVPSP